MVLYMVVMYISYLSLRRSSVRRSARHSGAGFEDGISSCLPLAGVDRVGICSSGIFGGTTSARRASG